MNGWMMVWTILLATSVVGFLGLLCVVGVGAVKELREMLTELQQSVSDDDAG